MASAKYSWSVAATKVLITEYEGHEMLYNSRHCDYKNRGKRLAIYENITESANNVTGTGSCTVADVEKNK